MNNILAYELGLMVCNGNRMDLPPTQIENYPAIKQLLIKAGGKYKKNGFDFPSDAQAIKERLLGGEKLDDKKKFQFFPTPDAVIENMLDRVAISPNTTWLEPSAGQGAIADKLYMLSEKGTAIELMPENIKFLAEKPYYSIEGDFLSIAPKELGTFDLIMANPPFTKGQDVDHVYHMYDFLNEGGEMVVIMSFSWTFNTQRKYSEFRDWLYAHNHTSETLDAGAFKESGTNVATTIIHIFK